MPDTDPLVDVLAEEILGCACDHAGCPDAESHALNLLAALDANPDLVLARLVERGVLTEVKPYVYDHDFSCTGPTQGWAINDYPAGSKRVFVALQQENDRG